MSSFLERLRDGLRSLPDPPTIGILAVSGGPDSVALLRGVTELWQRGELSGIRCLVAAHVNHQLRGDESDADQQFVIELAQSLDSDGCPIRYRTTRLTPSENPSEASLRQQRYDWLIELAQEPPTGWVATGHTADDQVETILHRLIRGTGLHGLAGMPARRRLAASVELIRPMLAITRADVLNYLAEIRQPFREDATNTDRRFTRNRIRHDLLPLLHEFNPKFRETLQHLAIQADEASAFLQSQAAILLADADLGREVATLLLDRSKLRAAPRLLIREAFRLLWQREGWPLGRMRFREWDRLANLVAGQERLIELPGRIRGKRTRDRILLRQGIGKR